MSGTSGYVYNGINQTAPPPDYPFANYAAFTPTAGLEDGAYSASVAGPMDEYDNVLVPYSWVFHADSTPPHVVETVPTSGSRDGYPDEPVVAWLDEPFQAQDLPASAVVVKNSIGEEVPGTLSAVSRGAGWFDDAPTGIQFTPLQPPFNAPGEYVATVGYVTDYCAHPVVTYTWTFGMACLFADAMWDEEIQVISCNGQEFSLSTGTIEGGSEYEWQHPKNPVKVKYQFLPESDWEKIAFEAGENRPTPCLFFAKGSRSPPPATRRAPVDGQIRPDRAS